MENLFNRKLLFHNFSKLQFNCKLQNAIVNSLIDDLATYLMFFSLQSVMPSVLVLKNPFTEQEELFPQFLQQYFPEQKFNVQTLVMQECDTSNIQAIQNFKGFDICINLNCLHHVNNLTSYISAIKSTLVKGGVFCGNFYGNHTLQHIKEIVVRNESGLGNVVHQRFNPTMSMQSSTALLQNYGFVNINTYSETVSYQFNNFTEAMQFLKSINERLYINCEHKATNRNIFTNNLQGKITLDFETIKYYCQNIS